MEPALLDALRLGAYQLLRTRVPPHAAVDTTVELVRAEAGSRRGRFVNAVLRRVGERDGRRGCRSSRPTRSRTRSATRRSRHAHPRWIAQAFADALGAGDRPSSTRRWPPTTPAPPCTCVARPGRDHGRGAGPRRRAASEAPYSPYGVHLAGRRPGAARRGARRVAPPCRTRAASWSRSRSRRRRSTAPTRPLARPVRGPRRQGGAARRALAGRRRAALDAVEPSRTAPTWSRRATGGLPVDVHVADGRDRPRCPTAPTTGCWWTRRAPASARCGGGPKPAGAVSPTTSPAGQAAARALAAALDAVRPGGVVAYVTCSPHLAETGGVVADVLRPHRGRAARRPPLLPGVPQLGDGPTSSCGRTGTAPTRCSSRSAAPRAAPARVALLRAPPHPDRPQHPVRRLRPPRRGGDRGASGPTGCTST